MLSPIADQCAELRRNVGANSDTIEVQRICTEGKDTTQVKVGSEAHDYNVSGARIYQAWSASQRDRLNSGDGVLSRRHLASTCQVPCALAESYQYWLDCGV